MAAPLFWTRLARDPWARFGLGLVAVLAILALLAPWLAPGDPFRGDLSASLHPPSGAFLLGTDAQGRDVLSRVLYGARLSLVVGLISQSVALLLGVTLGLVSGYYGRWMGGDGAYRARPGSARPRARVRAGGTRARRLGRAHHRASSPAQRDRPRDCCGHTRHRRRDHGGGRAVVHRPRRTAAHAVVGRDGRRGTGPAARRAVGLDR